MRYEKYKNSRYWAVYSESNQLICITVYKRGAIETIRFILELQGIDNEKATMFLRDVEIAYKAIIKMK